MSDPNSSPPVDPQSTAPLTPSALDIANQLLGTPAPDGTDPQLVVESADARSDVPALLDNESNAAAKTVEADAAIAENNGPQNDDSEPTASSEPEMPEDETQLVDEGQTPAKQKGLGPRWSYILARGTIVACIWAFFVFAFDPILRWGFVSSSESMVGAKVDVGQFSTQLFPPRVRIGELAVANQQAPDTNLFEVAQLDGTISAIALLKGSYIIDEATLTGLRWDTTRATSGALEKTDEPVDENQGPGLADQAEELGKQWANDLIDRVKLDYDPKNFESVRMATRYEDEWKNDFGDLETRIKGVDGKYKQLRNLIKNAKGKPFERIQAYNQARIEGTRLLRDLQKIKGDLSVLPVKARTDLTSLNAARQRDTNEIQRKVKDLFDGDGDDLSEFLLGPDLHHRVKRGLSWFKWADGRVDEYQGRPKPKRFRGEDVHFETLEPLPKYLVRLINVTGSGVIGNDQLAIEGTIRDITSDPIMHGKPIVMRLEGKGEGTLTVKSTFDRTQETPSNDFEFVYELPRIVEQKLGDTDSLAIIVASKHTRWHGKIRTVGDSIEGTVSLTQSPVTLTAQLDEDVDDRLRNIVTASVKRIRRIDALVRISGTVNKPKLKLETDLGRVISEGVKEGLNDQLSIEKNALIAKLNASFSEKQNGLVSLFNSQHSKIGDALKTQELGIQSLIPKIGANNGFDPSRLFK